jgi:hypothetical protein
MKKVLPNVLLCTLFALTGCTSLGPGAIQVSRSDYNMALRKTDDEQMLLNLVRLRYRDRPLFLEVSALNTQFSFSAGASARTELGQVDDLVGLGGNVVIEESPTVTYTPLQGADFVERVLTPIKIETLLLLDTSGWSSERVFRVLLDQMNDLRNAPRSTGPTPERVTEFEEFIRVARLLRQLELADLIIGGVQNSQIVLHFAQEARVLPEYLELTKLLKVDPTVGSYPITSLWRYQQQKNTINMRFRSFAGVMYFLSQSVDVPAEDVAAGRVTVTLDGNDQVFDWRRVSEGLMNIRSSPTPPENTSVTVFYRNNWFYIDDSDLDSKSTFSMLGQLFALQSGNATSMVPVLTIPVGG